MVATVNPKPRARPSLVDALRQLTAKVDELELTATLVLVTEADRKWVTLKERWNHG